MPNHSEAHHPLPSPSEVMARFGDEVLNNKNSPPSMRSLPKTSSNSILCPDKRLAARV
jgi:hypothetical protein